MKTGDRGLHLFYYPLIILSGMASAISVFVYFRMHTLLFGMHQFSVTSILTVLLICLAAGSRIGGLLSDKKSQHLLLFAILQGIAGIYALLHPFIFQFLSFLFDNVLSHSHPTVFEIGFIRPILSLLFLFIPVASVSAIVPVLARFFTRHIIQTGNRISLIFSFFFAGIALGMILSGFLLTRHIGLYGSLLSSSIIFLCISGICLVWVLKVIPGAPDLSPDIMAGRVRKTAMLFRKRKPVLETGAKLTRAMIRVHAVHGFTSAALLIVAFRIASANAFVGLSLLRIIILAVFFAGLSIGGALYKRITTRMVNGYLLMASLEIMTAFIILFSFLLHSFVVRYIAVNFQWFNAVSWQFISVSSLILLPSLITGIVLPLAARIYPRRLDQSGRNIGRLSALFFTGSLWGAIFTHGVLFPFAGSVYAVFFLTGAALLGGFFLLLRDSRLIRGFRLSFTALSILCIAGILFFAFKTGWIGGVDIGNVSNIEKQEGRTSLVTINKTKEEPIYINGIPGVITGSKNEQLVPAVLGMTLGRTVKSAMVVGFGTGVIASTLENLNVESIFIDEVYPEVLTLSANEYSEENMDILTSSRVDISTEDPVLFLKRSKRTFDLILSGYTSIKNVPFQFTGSFYRACLQRLANYGRLSQVLQLNGITKQEFRSLVRACTDVFPSVELWYLSPDRVMLLAAKHHDDSPYCAFAERFADLDKFGRLSRVGIEDIESLLGRRMMDDRQLRILAAGAPVNTDDHPYVEFSKMTIRDHDPELISQLAKEIRKSPEPDFEDPSCGYYNPDSQSKIEQVKENVLLHLTEN